MRVGDHYTRWEIGGEPQLSARARNFTDYTRWEIGGEPQLVQRLGEHESIIPDGRSGGNRNCKGCVRESARIIPDGRSGGNRNTKAGRVQKT